MRFADTKLTFFAAGLALFALALPLVLAACLLRPPTPAKQANNPAPMPGSVSRRP